MAQVCRHRSDALPKKKEIDIAHTSMSSGCAQRGALMVGRGVDAESGGAKAEVADSESVRATSRNMVAARKSWKTRRRDAIEIMCNGN